MLLRSLRCIVVRDNHAFGRVVAASGRAQAQSHLSAPGNPELLVRSESARPWNIR